MRLVIADAYCTNYCIPSVTISALQLHDLVSVDSRLRQYCIMLWMSCIVLHCLYAAPWLVAIL